MDKQFIIIRSFLFQSQITVHIICIDSKTHNTYQFRSKHMAGILEAFYVNRLF